MKGINSKYVLVKRLEEPKTEGFATAQVQDSFVYKGEVVASGSAHYIGNTLLEEGMVVLFAKYSPDTHEVEVMGEKMKMVRAEDIMLVL